MAADMITTLIGAALLAATAQAPAQEAAEVPVIRRQSYTLSQEGKALLRCSAAFAMVAHGQSQGDAASLKWPMLEERGKEFFVRSLAQLMDETGLERGGIAALAETEAVRLRDAGEIDKVMPACLVMLEASGV